MVGPKLKSRPGIRRANLLMARRLQLRPTVFAGHAWSDPIYLALLLFPWVTWR